MLPLLYSVSGCGEALFMSGLFHRPKIEADFKLTGGPVAVLVDDFQELCYWPDTTTVLCNQVIEELRDRNAAKILIPTAAVRHLRQTDPEFDERACTEIGRMLKAEQVVLIEVRSFYATENPVEATAAARMSVAVKVINVLEKTDRREVRLWPREREGRIVEADLSAEAVTRGGNRDGILRALTEALAEKIVKHFYDRRMADFEKE